MTLENFHNMTYLFSELNAPTELKSTIEALLNNPFAEVYENQIINALEIALRIKRKELNIAFLAPMQSGKTGTIYVLVNYILPALSLLKENENVLFVTSMRDTDLFAQNQRELEKEYFHYSNGNWTPKSSKIYVKKIDAFFTPPNPGHLVQTANIKLIIRDEDQYGCGEESTFDRAFFKEMRIALPTMPLLAISATPFDILDGNRNGNAVSIVEGQRPDGYYGITEMLNNGQIEDHTGFEPYTKSSTRGKIIYELSHKMEEYLNHLVSFDSGLAIIRLPKAENCEHLKSLTKSKYGSEIIPIIIGSNRSSDFNIQEGMTQVKNHVLNEQKRVLLIIVNALSAGKDLKQLKPHVRFIIETRGNQIANVAQGLPGRICGYHNNHNVKIMANIEILNLYSEFENDYEIFFDAKWQNKVVDQGVARFTTQVALKTVLAERTQRDITSVTDISFYELKIFRQTVKGLPLMSADTFDKLLSLFNPNMYNRNTKGFRLNIQDATVRVYTSYNYRDNRVFKMWDKSTVGSAFDDTGLHYNDTTILISNLPVNHRHNKLGFTGIRIIKGGEAYNRQRMIDTTNTSMYN